MTAGAFESEFRRLYLPLGMYALRLTGDTATAEDMVQNAFMKTWNAIQEGHGIKNFQAYIYRAVRNECLKGNPPAAPESLDRMAERAEEAEAVSEEEIDTSFRDARIWRAIDALPDRCREVFLMSKRDGMSQEEIAEEMGISIKTVKNQMTKALSRLRSELSPHHHRPPFLPFL